MVVDFGRWWRINGLQLNTTKNKEMVWTSGGLPPTATIDGVSLKMVRSYKNLGLHLDNELDWSGKH